MPDDPIDKTGAPLPTADMPQLKIAA